MAAEQIPGKMCACGCGRPAWGRARYSVECRHKGEKARASARAAARRQRLRNKPHHSPEVAARILAERAAPNYRQHVVKNDLERPARVVCKICCDLPWARTRDRRPEQQLGFGSSPVSGDNGLCRGCGEPYAPEPPVERQSVLRSSAGMAAREGDLHGYVTERGQNMKTLNVRPQKNSQSSRGGQRGAATLRIEKALGSVKDD